MTRNNFHNGEGDKSSRLKKYGVSALTSREFANTNQQFKDKCKNVGVEPTARQASRFRNKKGIVYNA